MVVGRHLDHLGRVGDFWYNLCWCMTDVQPRLFFCKEGANPGSSLECMELCTLSLGPVFPWTHLHTCQRQLYPWATHTLEPPAHKSPQWEPNINFLLQKSFHFYVRELRTWGCFLGQNGQCQPGMGGEISKNVPFRCGGHKEELWLCRQHGGVDSIGWEGWRTAQSDPRFHTGISYPRVH